MSDTDIDNLGADIVRYQREARFAETSPEQWAERLRQFLDGQPGIDGARIENVRQVSTAAGGSNGTLLFEATWQEGSEEHSGEMVLRFMPTRGLFHVYDVTTQFELQRALGLTDVPVPPMLWLDADGRTLGRPGYIMGRVDGASTPMTWMTSGIIRDASPAERHDMQSSYLEAMAKVHAVDWREIGLDWLEQRAAGSRPIEREVNWYWDALETTENEGYIAALAPIRDWLIANEPEGAETTLCHGDANYGNYLYVGTKVSAVVDWEMSFLGTPECDVTFVGIGDRILQEDVSPLEGTMNFDERVAEYERLSGRKLQNLPYYELFSAYRIAVINVLAIKHYPPEMIKPMLPIIEKGPKIAAELAAKFGVECRLPSASNG